MVLDKVYPQYAHDIIRWRLRAQSVMWRDWAVYATVLKLRAARATVALEVIREAREVYFEYWGLTNGGLDDTWEANEKPEFYKGMLIHYVVLRVVYWGKHFSAAHDKETPVYRQLLGAVREVVWTPDHGEAGRVLFISIIPDWRKMLDEGPETFDEFPRGLNQGIEIPNRPPLQRWKSFKLRSPGEVCIAEALDRAGVLFFPDCMANVPNKREPREPDFLVCRDGKWGILEVMGDNYHHNAAKDHERMRLFSEHGITVIHFFTTDECVKNPDEVVAKFLRLLSKQ